MANTRRNGWTQVLRTGAAISKEVKALVESRQDILLASKAIHDALAPALETKALSYIDAHVKSLEQKFAAEIKALMDRQEKRIERLFAEMKDLLKAMPQPQIEVKVPAPKVEVTVPGRKPVRKTLEYDAMGRPTHIREEEVE
jgi:hypothetical protein